MKRTLVLALGLTLALNAIGIPPAVASSDVLRNGSCSDGGRWTLELNHLRRRIEAEFEVRRSPVGDTWRVRLRHDDDVYFRGTRTADDDGEFSVDEKVRDTSGTDRFRARAIDSSTGEVCWGTARIRVATATVPTVTPTLVQRIDTSLWSPASPDPSGVVYLPDKGRLEICDSEVDEATGAGYHGTNLWETLLDGTVSDTGTTLPYGREPTGLGYDAVTQTLFVSDDDALKIWVVTPGVDGTYGTADDAISSIDVRQYGSTDTEDPTFDPVTGHLFFLDGKGTEVYDIDSVDGVFGNSDDRVTHFDIGWLGPNDFEGLASDGTHATLLLGARTALKIYEITKTGGLVRVLDATGIARLTQISGLTMAPASDGSGRMNYWIVDRGVDNDGLSSENDGQLFELT
jgi:hypothetical protein